MPVVEIPAHYGLVILGTVVAPFIGSMYMGSNVMNARKKFNVQYPNLYGTPGVHDKADDFNKVQRGHQNMLESVLFYLPLSIVAGLQHPLAVAAGGVCYTVGCLSYQVGYAAAVEKRNSGLGVLKYVGLLTSLISAIKFSIKYV